jgi:hypothetical protein
MRRISSLVAAALAATALSATLGADAAPATRLCEVHTFSLPCAWADTRPAGTVLSMSLVPLASQAILTTSGGAANPTFSCASSTAGLRTTNAGGGPGVNVNVQLTTLTFSSCTSVNPSGCSASATVTSLPTSGSFAWTGGNNGDLRVTAPVVQFTCPILGIPVTCSFGNGGIVTGQATGGSVMTIRFTNQAIVSTGGFGCPTSATWNAQYRTDSFNQANWLTDS